MPVLIGWKSSKLLCCKKKKETVNAVWFKGDKGGDLADDLIRCGLVNKVAKHKLLFVVSI